MHCFSLREIIVSEGCLEWDNTLAVLSLYSRYCIIIPKSASSAWSIQSQTHHSILDEKEKNYNIGIASDEMNMVVKDA
ncbi:predicted protein [Botrytis cinerea T4]|uniref:Uncharacterized protein n=1 Tax=Botryotinia fuckeliana (strain T4) TaxID=999810 RepID=G2YRE9_BOTF4|nr:predicted protein [Botrytis cinerea T4]